MVSTASRRAAPGPAALGSLTLGTAGHIDHGKTTLVRALTGRDTDRLKEEKERGISIELGFAELALPGGRLLSVVDVPGHERFVRNMVSGATGIDLFLLTVAADDGVMPQTREHLRIIELLGIGTGVVALTKIDAVDEEMVELAEADVRDFLETTRYADVPIVPVSGVTGQGLDRLLVALEVAGDAVSVRSVYPAVRMPVDRVFTLRGIGTVVTGTLWAGAVTPDEVVAILPALGPAAEHEEVRIRSIQVHDRPVEEAVGGQRVALNLTGLERREVRRGQWVVKTPQVRPSYLADARITLLTEASVLERVSRVRVDHGTQEVLAKLVLADRERLEPGSSAYAQLRFEELALMYPGDRFIIRGLTPVTTVGGGVVVDPSPHKHGTGTRFAERLAVLEEGAGEAIARLLLEEAFPHSLSRRVLEHSPYLWKHDGRKAVAVLLAPDAEDGAVETEQGGLFHASSLDALVEQVRSTFSAQAQVDAANPYLSMGELRSRLAGGKEWPALDTAVQILLAAEELVRSEHGLRSAEATGVLEGEEARLAEVALDRMVGAGANTPTAADLGVTLQTNEVATLRLLKALERNGRVTRVGEDLYYEHDNLVDLLSTIAEAMQERGQITLAEVRDLLGTTRRYAQALLEHMDSEGMTLRVGDARRMRRRKRGEGVGA